MTIIIPDRVWVEDNAVYASGSWNERTVFYSALLRVGAVDLMGNIINQHAFDSWMLKHTPTIPGQDSALQAGLEEVDNDH